MHTQQQWNVRNFNKAIVFISILPGSGTIEGDQVTYCKSAVGTGTATVVPGVQRGGKGGGAKAKCLLFICKLHP